MLKTLIDRLRLRARLRAFDQRRLLTAIGHVINSMRLGLAPLYVGLWVAVLAYIVMFLKHAALLAWGVWDMEPEHLMLKVVNLVDMGMVANFVVMTSKGGYSLFVQKFEDPAEMDDWMTDLNTLEIKIQMGKSLIGVSSVHLLTTFLQADHLPWDQIWKEVLVHMTFIVTTLGYALLGKMHMHKGHAPARQTDDHHLPHASTHAPALPSPSPEPVH